MCQLYVGADPLLYRSRARSVRLHGMVTSVRLENQFWIILERMAAQENKSSVKLISTLHDELLARRGEIENFASFLRVCCIRFEERRLMVPDSDAASDPPVERARLPAGHPVTAAR